MFCSLSFYKKRNFFFNKPTRKSLISLCIFQDIKANKIQKKNWQNIEKKYLKIKIIEQQLTEIYISYTFRYFIRSGMGEKNLFIFQSILLLLPSFFLILKSIDAKNCLLETHEKKSLSTTKMAIKIYLLFDFILKCLYKFVK